MKINDDIRQNTIFSIIDSDFSHLSLEFNKTSYIPGSEFSVDYNNIKFCRPVLLAKLQKDGFDGTPLMIEGFIPSLEENGFMIYDSNRLTFQQANKILKSL